MIINFFTLILAAILPYILPFFIDWQRFIGIGVQIGYALLVGCGIYSSAVKAKAFNRFTHEDTEKLLELIYEKIDMKIQQMGKINYRISIW